MVGQFRISPLVFQFCAIYCGLDCQPRPASVAAGLPENLDCGIVVHWGKIVTLGKTHCPLQTIPAAQRVRDTDIHSLHVRLLCQALGSQLPPRFCIFGNEPADFLHRIFCEQIRTRNVIIIRAVDGP